MTTRDKALAKALEWAQHAEHAAREYPHVASSDYQHILLAKELSVMWAKLAQELDDLPPARPVEDVDLPDFESGYRA